MTWTEWVTKGKSVRIFRRLLELLEEQILLMDGNQHRYSQIMQTQAQHLILLQA
jgi:hypothetical protein